MHEDMVGSYFECVPVIDGVGISSASTAMQTRIAESHLVWIAGQRKDPDKNCQPLLHDLPI